MRGPMGDTSVSRGIRDSGGAGGRDDGERGARACRRMDDGSAIYTVGDAYPAIRLDLFLKQRIPKLSRRRIQDAILVRVRAPGHGRPKPATLLRPGDTVIVERMEPPVEDEPTLRLAVLHQDDDLLVIDKPAGLLAHPSNRVHKGSVTYILSRQIGGPIHLLHRLDRETSGVMLVARNPAAARDLSAQIARSGQVARPSRGACEPSFVAEKSYLAIVFGEMTVQEGSIDLPIGKSRRSAVYVKRGVDHEAGRASRTRFMVEARGGGFSLVRIWLLTGRRHQIRVHLSAAGHPVVGDKLYGPAESHYLRFITSGFDETMRRELLTERQMLHASDVTIRHPRAGERVTFSAPLPSDMREFLSAAGLGS